MVQDRRVHYLERAAECADKAARAALPAVKEIWTEAAAARNELAALHELMAKIDRIYPDHTETESRS